LQGEKNKAYPKAIPVITVESEEIAKSFQISFGSLNMYDDRYIYTRFKGTLEHLNEVQQQFKEYHEKFYEK
jgi:hypothetical protein